MSTKMLIDSAHSEETRVVVVDGSRIQEFDYETSLRKQIKGNIYLAKVIRVEPSLQAAFVDYGGNKHGFLAFSEIHTDYYQIPVADRQALQQEEADYEAELERKRRSRDHRSRHERKPLEGDNTEPLNERSADEMQGAPEGLFVPEDRAEKLESVPDFLNQDTPDLSTETAEDLPSEGSQKKEDFFSRLKRSFLRRREEQFVSSPFQEEEETSSGLELSEEPRFEPSLSPPEKDSEEGESNEEESYAHELLPVSTGGEDALEELPPRRLPTRRRYKIQEVIKRRQVLLVQVVKEERGSKGAALTTYLSLAGRYCVLMPNTARGGGISRKISDNADRVRLREIVREVEVPTGMGLIVRTAGAQRTKLEIKRDFDYLLRMWENVRDLTLTSTAPNLVYEEGNLIKRALRDLYSKEIEEVLVEGQDGYEQARDFMRVLMPSHVRNIKLYRENFSLFSKFQAESQLDALFSPVVTLPSGGYLVINQTEALVAIDINSGRATREHNIEDTALKTNLEAADEIARQLRLRDLAGLIVVDFIDMEESRNNRIVERRMKEALRNDRARIQIGRISHFGLLEMSRQRLRPGMLEGATVVCPHCVGQGVVRSVSSCALSVLRAVEDYLISHKISGEGVDVQCSGDVASYLLNEKRIHILDLEKRYATSLFILPSQSLKFLETLIEVSQVRQIAVKQESAVVVKQESAVVSRGEPRISGEEEGEDSAETTEEQTSLEPQTSVKRRKRRRRNRRGSERERVDFSIGLEYEQETKEHVILAHDLTSGEENSGDLSIVKEAGAEPLMDKQEDAQGEKAPEKRERGGRTRFRRPRTSSPGRPPGIRSARGKKSNTFPHGGVEISSQGPELSPEKEKEPFKTVQSPLEKEEKKENTFLEEPVRSLARETSERKWNKSLPEAGEKRDVPEVLPVIQDELSPPRFGWWRKR